MIFRDVYEHPAHPQHYVVQDNRGGWWMFPVLPLSPRALDEKRPWDGDRSSLVPVTVSKTRWYRSPKAKHHRVVFVVDEEQRARLYERADEQGLSVGEYIRRMCLL